MKKYIAALIAFVLSFLMLYPLLIAPPADYRAIKREEKKPKWQGVITIWLCETFYPGSGSFYGWLRDACKAYEKSHDGVLINLESVTPFVVTNALDTGDDLPDAIICGPSVIGSTKNLVSCDIGTVYETLLGAAAFDEINYAMPLSLGGYTIIADKARMEGYSGELSSLILENKKSTSYALSCPKTQYISYSAGLSSMLSLSFDDCDALSPDICRRSVSDAWADFVLDKKSSAYACTQKEVYRMRKLEAGGSAFPWEGFGVAGSFSDQLLAMYFPIGSRFSTATDIGHFLQSEDMQTKLSDIGAFSVNLTSPMYGENTIMRAMEDALSSAELIVPNMFYWFDAVKEIAAAESAGADRADAIAPAKAELDKLHDLR